MGEVSVPPYNVIATFKAQKGSKSTVEIVHVTGFSFLGELTLSQEMNKKAPV